MPCVQSKIIHRQAIINLIILPLNSITDFNINQKGLEVKSRLDGKYIENIIKVPALIDTGANCSCITTEMADKIGIRADGLVPSTGIHGSQLVYNYYVDLILYDVHHVIKDIELIGIEQTTTKWSALIGMDIIQRGTLHLNFPDDVNPNSGICTFCV